MAILEILAILVGIFSALIGFSSKVYFALNLPTFYADQAYVHLMTRHKLDDRNEVWGLLQIVMSQMAPLDSSGSPQFGMLRKAQETVRLEMKAGVIEQEPENNFVGIHPVYGYNSKGEVTIRFDKSTFYEAYHDRVQGRQQREAFLVLLVAFLIQLIGVFIRF